MYAFWTNSDDIREEMKLSYNWLKEYIRTDRSCEEIAQKLTMSGSEIESVEEKNGDKVMDLEITSNRPDCLSVIGLAREVGALVQKSVEMPVFDINEDVDFSFPCEVIDKDLCPEYSARVIKNVKVSASEEKIKKALGSSGLRSVNNIVDITNYCLFELGQPLHAFDMDKIQGKKLIVRKAKKGEKIAAIDEETYELDESMLVIADEAGPVAIAGVMGGLKSGVTLKTRNIVLESAYFDPANIRATAAKLGISTDSSYRFERGVDKGGVKFASDRATSLIKEKAGGEICALTVKGKNKSERPSIDLPFDEIKRYVGIEIPKDEVVRILKSLGIDVAERTEKALKLQIPSYREDLVRKADIVEEVLRIHGYNKVPAQLSKLVASSERKSHPRRVIDKIRTVLPGMGLKEIMTYSLINEDAAGLFEFGEDRELVKLKNPLSEDQNVLAPHLIDGMLRAVSYNLNRQMKDLAFFEVGKRYFAHKGKLIESEVLSLGITGNVISNWRDGQISSSFYHLKGIVEELMARLSLKPDFSSGKKRFFSTLAKIEVPGESSAGFIGKIEKELLNKYDIEQDVFCGEIYIDRIQKHIQLSAEYERIPKFPSSSRDISVLADESMSGGQVIDIVEQRAKELLRNVMLSDIYRGEQVPQGKKSLTFSIEYGHPERTLTDEEVDKRHDEVKEALEKELGISFR